MEPHTEQSAFDILDLLDFDVFVLPVISTGTALISKGFLDAARRRAMKVLDALNKIDPEYSLPIVGIEPPEISSFKHDYLDLLPQRADEISRRVEKVWSLDEFLVRCEAFTSLGARKKEINSSKVKFHPHCHQRAEGLRWMGNQMASVRQFRLCKVVDMMWNCSMMAAVAWRARLATKPSIMIFL